VLHGFFASNSFVFVIDQHFLKQVDSFSRDSVLVTVSNKGFEGCLFGRFDQFRNLLRKVKLVSAQVFLEVICSHYAHDASHLVIVITTLEESVNIEKHASKSAT